LSGVSVAIPLERFRLVSTIVVGLLGMAVTIIAGVLSLGQHQEHWIEYRAVCEGLKKEKFLFQTRVEPYNGDNAFQLLIQRVETLVSKENTNWVQYTMKPEQENVED
jgi:Protein of unknown function (DUF4231)